MNHELAWLTVGGGQLQAELAWTTSQDIPLSGSYGSMCLLLFTRRNA